MNTLLNNLVVRVDSYVSRVGVANLAISTLVDKLMPHTAGRACIRPVYCGTGCGSENHGCACGSWVHYFAQTQSQCDTDVVECLIRCQSSCGC